MYHVTMQTKRERGGGYILTTVRNCNDELVTNNKLSY